MAIVVSGVPYQEAAAWAAPTYCWQVNPPEAVCVVVPEGEAVLDSLKAHSLEYGFRIKRFPLKVVSERKYTSQLKCQGFLAAVSELKTGELLLLVDADTYCLKRLSVLPEVRSAVLAGKIGLVPDILNHHFQNPAEPWYLTPKERRTYVNSGVILASRKSLDMFKTFRRLSDQRRFLHGPFNDQKVINFALGKFFGDRLLLLGSDYNGIRNQISPTTIIGHCTGGAGFLGAQPRRLAHLGICAELLGKPQVRTGSSAEDSAASRSLTNVGRARTKADLKAHPSQLVKSRTKAPVGVLILTVGKSGEWARNCLGSLRRTNPELPFALVADRPCDFPFHWINSQANQPTEGIKPQLHQYSSYGLTLLVEACAVFAKRVNPGQVLGEADIAFAFDSRGNLAGARRWFKDRDGPQELEETISTCGAQQPLYGTKIILWRNHSAAARNFFDRWHEEWSKYQGNDQLALLRALKNAELKIKILPASFTAAISGRKCDRRAHIQLIQGQPAAGVGNFWRPPPAGPFEMAYARAVTHGLMSENQYQYLARELYSNRPCSLLSIGGGHDSELWFECAQKNVAYVESNPRYLPILPANPVHYEFKSRVGQWLRVPQPPPIINKKWDYVIVDGPPGFNRDTPGRQIPVAWAARLALKAVFVHDYDRSWERAVCNKYLGEPAEVLLAPGRIDRFLAVFRSPGKRASARM